MPKYTIQLGKSPRELRYDFPAFVLLEEGYGIVVTKSHTWSNLSPKQGSILVWVGQLGNPKPMTLEQVRDAMPSNLDKFFGIMETVTFALKDAMGLKDKEAPAEDEKQ